MQTANVTHDFPAVPVERLFDYIAEHENGSVFFAPMKFERIKNGTESRNGVGSMRRVTIRGRAPFVETITVAVPSERIEYEITEGSPLRDHHGTILFSSLPDGGSHLDYTITFRMVVPGMAPVAAAVLRRGMTQGFAKVEQVLAA